MVSATRCATQWPAQRRPVRNDVAVQSDGTVRNSVAVDGGVTFLPGTNGQLKSIQGRARGTNWGADKPTGHR